jgi:hypothetical protein
MNTVRQPSIQLSPKGGKGDRSLSLWDNQRLGCGFLQPSRMASCFTQRVWVRAASVRVMPPATEVTTRVALCPFNEVVA